MKQITIYDLLPLLKKGWVAYDNETWWWYQTKPIAYKRHNCWMVTNTRYMRLKAIGIKTIAPFDGDWKDSLIKVEHKEEE